MPAESPVPVETTRPDPHRDRPAATADAPNSTSRLLTLVRALIDYGKQFASTLQHRNPTEISRVARPFGTITIAQVLACITRGLQRAAELEARLIDRLAHPPAAPSAHSVPSLRQPPAPPPRDQTASPAEPRLPRLPTPEHIAAKLRHRPIGAVLADICRDLGITWHHPLWKEISRAITLNGGNFPTLSKDIYQRLTSWLRDPHAGCEYPEDEPAPDLSSELAPATGPP